MPTSPGLPLWVRETDRRAEFKNGGGRHGFPEMRRKLLVPDT